MCGLQVLRVALPADRLGRIGACARVRVCSRTRGFSLSFCERRCSLALRGEIHHSDRQQHHSAHACAPPNNTTSRSTPAQTHTNTLHTRTLTHTYAHTHNLKVLFMHVQQKLMQVGVGHERHCTTTPTSACESATNRSCFPTHNECVRLCHGGVWYCML